MKKTIFITGSTDGIGKLAAIKLANDGHEIILHGRNPKKLATVISEIKTTAKNENIKGYAADFSDLAAVKQMAQTINKEVSKIDVLINNAGVFKSSASHNKDGLDIRLVVNYLAPYILTEKLLSLLNQGNEPRLINLSSAAQNSVSHQVLLGNDHRSDRETYGQSKLALTMWSFDLAKKLPNLIVIPVNPGSLLNTNMVKEAFGTFWSSADKGATILYDLAVSERYKNSTGKYFDNDRGSFGTAHPDAYDEIKIEQLMKITEEILAN